MADEKYKDENPEEENDNQFDDDEDFGLPDLEYDELDDDEDSDIEDDSDMGEVPDFKEPEEEPDADEGSKEVLGTDEFDEEVEINVEDIDDSEAEEWEKELEKELEEELKTEDAGGFYEEESYEDFETSGEETIKNSVFSSDDRDSDDFGASGVEDGSQYTENATVASTSDSFSGGGTANSYQTAYQNDNPSKGKFVRTVVIGTLAFAVIAVFLYFLWDSTGGVSEPEKTLANKEQSPPSPPQEPVRQESEPVQEESTPPVRQEASQPNNVAPGEITVLEQRTGKSYVVIGSFFDGDMANDYASELAAEGKSPLVIPPFKDYRYYRVAIAEFDNFQDAQASIDGYRNEYGQEVWPLRY